MAVEYTRVTVVILSVLLLSWGSFANFNPVFATTSIEDLQKLKDDLNIEFNKVAASVGTETLPCGTGYSNSSLGVKISIIALGISEGELFSPLCMIPKA